MKETRHVVERKVPMGAIRAGKTGPQHLIIQQIKAQMARECVDIVMEKMIFIEDRDDVTQEFTIRGVVHIMSEHERIEIGSQKGIAGPHPASAEEIARAGGRELPPTWTKAEYEQAMKDIKLNADPPSLGDPAQLTQPASVMTATGLQARQEEANRECKARVAMLLSNPPTMGANPLEAGSYSPGIFAKKAAEIAMKPGLLNAEMFSRRQEQNNREDWVGTQYALTTLGELIMSEKFWETGAQFEGEPEQIKQLPPVTVLVDGDIVAYRCAATCDGRQYKIAQAKGGMTFGYKKDAVAYCDKNGIPNSEIELVFNPEPIDAALHNINVTMDNIKNYFIYEKKMNPQIKTFLSAARNFRYDIFPDYKKSRQGVRKPHWIKECKEFLSTQHEAFLFPDYEADDLIAMTVEGIRSQKQVFIASCDKDFTQLGGENVVLYDFTTGKEWDVTRYQAMHYFYKQILMGDKTDDIPGIPRVGSQTAIKILVGCKEERDLYNAVVLAYKERMELTTEQAIEAVTIRGKLLYLTREEGKLWTPPPPRELES